MLDPVTAPEDFAAAWHCQTGARVGQPHMWTYLNDLHKNYRCASCLIVMTKARLKELTDNA